MEFEYLLNIPLSSLTVDRIEDLHSNARKTQSKLEIPCHTPDDLYVNLEPSAHYILLIFYNNSPTHQPSPLYMPPPLLLWGNGGVVVHEILSEGGRVNSDDGKDGGG